MPLSHTHHYYHQLYNAISSRALEAAVHSLEVLRTESQLLSDSVPLLYTHSSVFPLSFGLSFQTPILLYRVYRRCPGPLSGRIY